MEEEDIVAPDTPPKKKQKIKQKHGPQKFRPAWLQDNAFKTWLAKVPNDEFKAKCQICNVTFNAELTVIKNHMKSQSHLRKPLSAQPAINTFLKKADENTTINKGSQRLEIKLCAFLAEHNISFTVIDHLTTILKESITDSKIVQGMQLKATKGTAIVKNVIGQSEKERLQRQLKSSFFSVLIDESTDIGGIQTMCIIVRFFDAEEGRVVSKFWDLCQVFEKVTDSDGATAAHLFGLISNSLQAYEIPFRNIIGFASDGCSTMMGKSNSVASRFLDKCPGIYIFKCICHSLHLCANNACKTLPRNCEDLAQNVYGEFKNSAKRQHQFEQVQSFLDIQVHKILRPSQTRWLSLTAVVSRILEQWDALQLYFRGAMSTARLVAVQQIVQSLDNPIMKLYYLFLEWVLPKFTKLNEFFQSESVILTSLYDKMRRSYQELLETYLCKFYIHQTILSELNPSNKEQRLLPEQMYFGVKVMSMLSTPAIHQNERLKSDFRTTCVDFLIVGCEEIKKRFNFDDPVLKLVSCLHPSKAMLRITRDTVPSLLPLMEALPRIAFAENYQKIDDEWRQLPFFELPDHIGIKDQVDIFWAKVMSCDEEDQGLTFKNLAKFALDTISLPHSNADSERVFSQINLIKTKTRNKMVTSTVNGVLLSKQRVKGNKGNCTTFEPSKDEYSRMTKDLLYQNKKTTTACTGTKIQELYSHDDIDEFDNILMPNESH